MAEATNRREYRTHWPRHNEMLMRGSARFLLVRFDCNDILERPVANRVVALSCVCYQQGRRSRA
jgi:hypothetical protein